MECSEARRLIDEGVHPGSTDPQRAALGFHLTRCAPCRAYRANPGLQGLLAALLTEEAPAPAASAPPPPAASAPSTPAAREHAPRAVAIRPGPPHIRRRRRPAPWWRYALVGILAVLALSSGLVLGRIARAAYTIRGNVAAMQVTAAPTRASGTPTLAVPTSSARLSVASVPEDGAGASSPATSNAGISVGPSSSGAAAPEPTASTAAPEPTASAAAPEPTASAAAPEPTASAAAPTAISLPPIGDVAPLPTLMATVGVAPVSGEAINILLLGSDRRPGESWQNRSDAIMVVRLEPARQRVALLSFPRDLIVNIPGYGYSRINATTVYGEVYPELGGGLELARATVSDLLGIPIHHVARADFNAFITAIDAIGGVDLVVEKELYDPQYPTMDYGYTVAHFLPGPQHMDGQTALMYARLRHADSDYYRARRQQQVIQAIMQRVREQNILGQVQMMADLSSALSDDIQTDLSLDQMIGIAWAFRNFSPDLVERYTLDENLTTVGAAGDPYAITAAPGAIQYLVGQLLNGVAPP